MVYLGLYDLNRFQDATTLCFGEEWQARGEKHRHGLTKNNNMVFRIPDAPKYVFKSVAVCTYLNRLIVSVTSVSCERISVCG
jgi:hypothetical protein